MTTERFNLDLEQARNELMAATAQVMELVRAKKTSGNAWKSAIERERKAHETIAWLLDSPLASRTGGSLRKFNPKDSDPE